MPSAGPAGPQKGIFSYFHVNPEIHSREKPYDILINLAVQESDPHFRRHNKEFEEHKVTIQDVRGRADDFTLDKNGFCWRHWEGPPTWKDANIETVKAFGNTEVEEVYNKEAEKFIALELERQDGKPVDIVKVFDYRVRSVLIFWLLSHSRSLYYRIQETMLLIISSSYKAKSKHG